MRAQSDMAFEEELAILETRNEKKGAAAAATKTPAADGGKTVANAAKKTETAAAVQKKVNGVTLSLAKTNINSTKTAKEDVSGTFGTAVRTYLPWVLFFFVILPRLGHSFDRLKSSVADP